MSNTAEERLARIEEFLKHIDDKLDCTLVRQTATEASLVNVREQLIEMKATLKIQRIVVIIGLAVALGGAGALTKVFGIL